MKNSIKKIFVVAMLGLVGIFSVMGQTAETLDAAIDRAFKDMLPRLGMWPTVALLNFNTADEFSAYVLREMTNTIEKSRAVILVSRQDIDRALSAARLKTSGEISDADAQRVGRNLGAALVITGTLVRVGDNYGFRTRLLSVRESLPLVLSDITLKDSPQIQKLLGYAPSPAPVPPAPASAPVQTPAPVPAPTSVTVPAVKPDPAPVTQKAYQVGDTGPAGGLIFYDKGNNTGGWRYLEAAPEEAEFRAKWSETSFLVADEYNRIRSEIGFGKSNTRLIIAKCREVPGNWDTAAQQCDNLALNGFDDWFLPSQSELDQIFGNLKRKNIGNFKNELYWSSTETSGGGSAYIQNFNNGKLDYYGKTNIYYVRPIRQVAESGTR